MTRDARAAAFVLFAVLSLVGRSVAAEDRVTVRGVYFREPSTRVVQPVVEIAKDVPHGVDVNAYYLLDAITSASAAAGAPGDNIFTEYRNEAGLGIGKTWSRFRVGGAYRYSAESDYWSHALVASAALRMWGDTATVALTGGLGKDEVGRRAQGLAPAAVTPGARCMPSAAVTCPLDSWFGGVGYSQVLSPTWVLQAGYESIYMRGFLSSPYRQVGTMGAEVVPDNRWRNALSARLAKYFPRTKTGIQLHYRYYWDVHRGASTGGEDPWQVRSHTVEGRVYQTIGRDVEVRLSGRFYSQGAANLWCDVGSQPGCYTGMQLFTSDPKLGPVKTGYIDAKIFWDAARWRDKAFLGWFSGGTFELSYGRFVQSTSFASAHVLQTGYSLPF